MTTRKKSISWQALCIGLFVVGLLGGMFATYAIMKPGQRVDRMVEDYAIKSFSETVDAMSAGGEWVDFDRTFNLQPGEVMPAYEPGHIRLTVNADESVLTVTSDDGSWSGVYQMSDSYDGEHFMLTSFDHEEALDDDKHWYVLSTQATLEDGDKRGMVVEITERMQSIDDDGLISEHGRVYSNYAFKRVTDTD